MFVKSIKTNENKFFFFYLLFLFFSASIFLFNKHTVGNDSTISEWLINYQGGFTRRGLLGDLAFNLALLFEAKIRFVIFLFQSVLDFLNISFIRLILRLVVYSNQAGLMA